LPIYGSSRPDVILLDTQQILYIQRIKRYRLLNTDNTYFLRVVIFINFLFSKYIIDMFSYRFFITSEKLRNLIRT
jgi:hypothetical protein